MRKAALQELVMNVLAIGGKNRTTAEETAQDGKSGFQNRQAKRDDRNRHRDDRRSLLCALEGESAQHESDEKASAVPQEDGRRAEVKTEKPQNRAREHQGHERNQRRP